VRARGVRTARSPTRTSFLVFSPARRRFRTRAGGRDHGVNDAGSTAPSDPDGSVTAGRRLAAILIRRETNHEAPTILDGGVNKFTAGKSPL
jgi:hypothetical protein